jgi:hypothetical protein
MSRAASLYFSSCSSKSMINSSRAFLKASVSTFSIGAEKPFRIFFTRLRRHAPCRSTGRNGDRRPRRSPQGEAGFASAQFSSPSSGCPAEERGVLNRIPELLDDFNVKAEGFELLPWRYMAAHFDRARLSLRKEELSFWICFYCCRKQLDQN